MRKNTLYHKHVILIYLVIILTVFTSCDENSVDDVFDTSSTAPSSFPQISSETQQSSADISSNETDKIIPPSQYKYQLPKECEDIYWEYDDALSKVTFKEIQANYSNLDERYIRPDGTENYDIVPYDISNVIPKSIYQALEKRLIESLDGVLSENGKFDDFAYLSHIEYFKFDLNSDGLEDILAKSVVAIANPVGGGTGQYASAIFITQKDGTYKEINCRLDFDVSILKSKTNGMYDILTGYYGDDVCKFNGKDSYDIPYYSKFRFGNDYNTILENNIINFAFLLVSPNLLEYDQYYIVIYVDDERIKENILYSCTKDGTPKTYAKEDLIAIHYIFYAEISNVKVESYDDISFKQMKFIPVNKP